MTTTASWVGFSTPQVGADLLEPVRNVLETLMVFLEIAKAILDTIKAFLVDFGNPLIALLEALISLITTLFKALQQTGIYALYDIPDPFRDPNWKRLSGGFPQFKQRWKGSLLDIRDSHRPQPISGALQGGFFIFVFDSDGPLALVQLVKSVMQFFKMPTKFISPQYPPPLHLKATPLKPGGSGDPILAVADMFSTQVTDIAVEWQLPSNTPSGDVGFAGTTSQIVQSFRVPNWLIEFGLSPPTQPITVTPNPQTNTIDPSALKAPDTTGRVVQITTLPFTDPRNLSSTFNGQAPLTDEHGDPIIKMSYYAIVDGFAAFSQAQLGTVRFVYTNVPLDKDIYVRVRAFFGQLSTSAYTDNRFVTLNWGNTVQPIVSGSKILCLPWPTSASPPTQMSMGKPSPMVHTKIATLPGNIDVISDLTAIFQAGFSLNFHVQLPPATPELDSHGKQLLDARGNPVYFPQFDSAGNPLPPLTDANIGQGSMTAIAGGVAGNIFAAPATGFGYANYQPDPVTGQEPQQPWQNTNVIYQSRRLANKFASIMLAQGGPVLQAFRTLMRGPLPAGSVDVSWPGVGTPTYLEQLVLAMTAVTSTPPALPANSDPSVVAAAQEALPSTVVSFNTAQAYASAFSDASVRKNVLAAVTYLNSLNFQGTPPDWISVSLLDLIPWSGQLLYDLIAKIQGLVDAYKGVTTEITNFINMLERKINTLESFIEYLLGILNYLLNLEAGFYVLPVPKIEGDVTAWLSTIDQAGGNVPPSGPSGYTAGVTLAYLAPDVTALAAAFNLLF